MKLLITGALKEDKSFFSEIESLGHSVTYVQDETVEIIDNICREAEGIVCNSIFLHNPIEKFLNLHYIQLTSAGYDRIPMNYINSNNIKLFNARGVYSTPIAEFVLCGVLGLYKRMQAFRKNQDNSFWLKRRDVLELYGKNVCIVGCGSVGGECAKRFSAFGCNVRGIELETRQDENYSSITGLEYLDSVIEMSDIVVLTLPLTDKTHHMFDGDRLKKLKNGSVFVNVSRGGIVDTDALICEMPRLLGAVLDVFETEPLPVECPLWHMENVIVTPHNSFVGENNYDRLKKVILDNLKSL